MSTDIANRSTINDLLESIQVPVDIHVDKNQSIAQSEESHIEPSSKPLKRKKAQKGGLYTKKNNQAMEISNKTKGIESDLNKIEVMSSENVEINPKHARGPKGKFIRNTQANDTNVNTVGEASGVSQNNDRVSKGRKLRVGDNKLAQNIKENVIEKAKKRKERLDRETSKLNVRTRNQPTRKVVAAAAADVANDDVSDISDVSDVFDDSDVSDGHESEFSFIHESSEAYEVSSDDTDDYCLTDVYNSMHGASDTEMQQ